MMFTKVSGVLLATLLVVLGLKEVAHIVYHPHELEEPAYVIAVPEETSGTAVAEEEGPVDFGALIPAVAPGAGEAVARKCLACHTFDAGGPVITGPNLHDVLGRVAGAAAGFNYSDAMASYGQPWSYENMDAFLENPRAYLPGTAMVFVGLPSEEERIAILAYLREINAAGAPPLPAPLPAAADAADAAPVTDAAATDAAVTDAPAPAEAAPAGAAADPGVSDAAEAVDDAEAALADDAEGEAPQ